MVESRWSRVTLGALMAFGATLMACSGDGSSTTPGGEASTVQVRISASAPESAGMNARAARFNVAPVVGPSGVGEASPERLEYFFTSIMLCENLETNGTAFNNPQGCVELYSNHSVDYDTYGYADARADATSGHYFDLMDSATMTALNAAVQVQPGTYRWALATWNRPVRVQATIPLSGSGSLFTKDGDRVGSDYTYTEASSPLDAGPSERAIVDLNNGGTWFRLQQPVVIPEDGGAYTLSLVFNPDRLIKASASGASNASIQENGALDTRGIYVPLLDLTPVLHRSDDAVRKESYILTGQDQFSIRLELYSAESDPEHAILGADVKTLYTPSTTLNLMHPSKVSFLSTTDAGITFEIWDHSPMLEGFTRSASGGTVTLHCATAFYSTEACGGASTVTLTYAAPDVTTLP